MKKLVYLSLASLLVIFTYGCDDNDDNPTGTGDNGIGSTISAEGFNFDITASGQTTTHSKDELFDESFGGSRNIAGFFKLLRFYTDDGTIFLRTHFGKEFDNDEVWQEAILGETGLYNAQYRQEWTPELKGKAMTLTFVGGSLDGEYFAGDVTIYRDYQTNAGIYSLYGEIDARADGFKELEGTFWAKEFDWED
jgi:hypothetical protein